MFTGIVDHWGRIETIEVLSGEPLSGQSDRRAHIACRFTDIKVGESIAVDGCCLTVTEPTPLGFRCDLSPETLSRTIAGQYLAGSMVNLERALRLGDRLGGHYVTGHIDSTGRLAALRREGQFFYLVFRGEWGEDHRLLTPKGSVAVSGISLTVNEVFSDGFSVMIIPHTWERTALQTLREGSHVNIEFDWMTKVVLREADRRLSQLQEYGWKDSQK